MKRFDSDLDVLLASSAVEISLVKYCNRKNHIIMLFQAPWSLYLHFIVDVVPEAWPIAQA